MNNRIIFVDLDETLWHSTTPTYIEKGFLLPKSRLADSKAERALLSKIEKDAEKLLNDRGLIEGTFEFERKIHDAKNEVVSTLAVKRGWKEFWFSGGEHYLSKLRNKVPEFLEALSRLGELHVCTSSTTEYANLLTEEFKIKKFFKTISAREQIKSDLSFEIPEGTKWILIDDRPPFSDSIMKKMRFLTGKIGTQWEEGQKRVFQVKEWVGNPLDCELLSIIDGIKEKLDNC